MSLRYSKHPRSISDLTGLATLNVNGKHRESLESCMSSRGTTRANPSTGRQPFPWTTNGITFRSRGHFEQVVEQFINAGTPQHLKAARTLVNEASVNFKLTTDQYNALKERLQW